jgi:hypothetical protein
MTASQRKAWWDTHIGGCQQWYSKITKILIQSPDQDDEVEALLRIPPASYIGQASELAAQMSSIERLLYKVANYQPEEAYRNPSCLKIVAFNNVIHYMTQSNREFSFVDNGNLWGKSIEALGLKLNDDGTTYAQFYAERGEDQSKFVTLSSDDLMVIQEAMSRFVNLRGPTPEVAWNSVPYFVAGLVVEYSKYVDAGGAHAIELTSEKQYY